MLQSKKFGTFAGVFTPSILTILGVIMYMRLGWVVGEAGLIAAIGIIILAHVISVTTGLSISSIATDKKIKPVDYITCFQGVWGCQWVELSELLCSLERHSV